MCIVTLVHAFKRHWHSLGGVRWFFRSFGNLVICVMFTVLMVFLMVEWLQAEPPVGLFAPPPRVSSIYGGCLSTWCGFCISVAECIVASVPPKREINRHWYKLHCYVNSTNMSMNNWDTLLKLMEYFNFLVKSVWALGLSHHQNFRSPMEITCDYSQFILTWLTYFT